MQKRIVDYTREEVDSMFGYDTFPSEFLTTFNQERNRNASYKQQVDNDIENIVRFINDHVRKLADRVNNYHSNLTTSKFWDTYISEVCRGSWVHKLSYVDVNRVKGYLNILDYNFGTSTLHTEYTEQFVNMYSVSSSTGQLACDLKVQEYPDHIDRYTIEVDDPIISTSLAPYRLCASNSYWKAEYKEHPLDVWIAITYYFFGLSHTHNKVDDDILNSVFGDFAVVHQGLLLYVCTCNAVNNEWDNVIMNILYSIWSFGSAWSMTHTEKEVRRIVTESFSYVQDHINVDYGRQSIQDHARIWVNLVRWGIYNEITAHYNIHAPMHLNLRSCYFEGTRYDYCGGSIDMKWVSGSYQNSILYGEWGCKNKLYDSSLDMPKALNETFTVYRDKWITDEDRKQKFVDRLLVAVLQDINSSDNCIKYKHPVGMSDYEYSKLRHKEDYLEDTVEVLKEVLADEFKGL